MSPSFLRKYLLFEIGKNDSGIILFQYSVTVFNSLFKSRCIFPSFSTTGKHTGLLKHPTCPIFLSLYMQNNFGLIEKEIQTQ